MELQDPTLLRTQAYVGGEWIDADSGATFDVTDPATGDVVASVADLGVPASAGGAPHRGRAW